MNHVGLHQATTRPDSTRADEYDDLMKSARRSFDDHPSVAALFREPLEASTLEAFLMYFSALGVWMTEPVEDWIARAGNRCDELGLFGLATALRGHARQEADHHLLMQADARRLVDRWNQHRESKMSAAELLAISPTPGVREYRRLHENVIAGAAPYGQLAIEYEIEMLSVKYGPELIQRCLELLGPDIVDCLSFLRDHVELDVGHTQFNRIQLSRLLEEEPAFLLPLVSAGSTALNAYAQFLDDCLGLTRRSA
jgi:hypothetical protein